MRINNFFFFWILFILISNASQAADKINKYSFSEGKFNCVNEKDESYLFYLEHKANTFIINFYQFEFPDCAFAPIKHLSSFIRLVNLGKDKWKQVLEYNEAVIFTDNKVFLANKSKLCGKSGWEVGKPKRIDSSCSDWLQGRTTIITEFSICNGIIRFVEGMEEMLLYQIEKANLNKIWKNKDSSKEVIISNGFGCIISKQGFCEQIYQKKILMDQDIFESGIMASDKENKYLYCLNGDRLILFNMISLEYDIYF